MTNSNLSFHFFEDTESDLHEYIFNISKDSLELILNHHFALISVITSILIFLACIIGIVGNGITIWILGVCMKRNPFTTYILNLAIADIGVLITVISLYILPFLFSGNLPIWGICICSYVQSLMYITDQLILTVVSIDRCVAVLFPIWHRCHRPPRLSSIVCVCIWVFSCLISGLDILLTFANQFILLQFIVNVAICTPLMAVSTVILFVKIYTKSQQHQRGKLLTVIVLALFFFLIFGFPMNYFYFLIYYYFSDGIDLMSLLMAALGCAVLNCNVNPVVYFLVGRKKKGRSRLSMKVALQRVFTDEEICGGQQGTRAETQF
ncbi:mas-related G-protein coupled receptor member H-like [Eublepharis macularius]|uniref:Mas-related G-protein coupled receptor member H-like n=1 Tax=Eublepharis macularius TaxID=481883 RepID=A0AA97JP45_EUBMA|nr:mas-related G-protein coupled receptor member H-like [Eublepharis macularius]